MQPKKFKYKPIKTPQNQASSHQTLFRGRHFSFLSVNTRFGRKEVLARNNRQFYACKVLPLVISEDFQGKLEIPKRECSIEEFVSLFTRHELSDKVKIPVLSVARPIAQFYGDTFSSPDIYELPGGVVGSDEDFQLGGIRELKEELGLDDQQVLAHAVLMEPSPFDSGSHVELMGIVIALISGDIRVVNWESIKGEETKLVPFIEIDRFLDVARENRIMCEGYLKFSLLLFRDSLINASN